MHGRKREIKPQIKMANKVIKMSRCSAEKWWRGGNLLPVGKKYTLVKVGV